jgi:membrane protease YdiL (CAAX protease family)
VNGVESQDQGFGLAARPVAFVVIVQLVAMAVFGPFDAWAMRALSAHMSALAAEAVISAVQASIVVILFVKGGWWARPGPASGRGTRKAATVAILLLAYPILRVESWHDRAATEVALVLVSAAAVAASEELIWRGWVLGTLKRHFGSLAAVLVSSFLFGLAHLANLAHGGAPVAVGFKVIWATCLGVFFAGLLTASRSYWPSILAHAAINTISDLSRSSRFQVIAGTGVPIDLPIVAPLFAIVGMYLCCGEAHRKRWLLALGCYAVIAATGMVLSAKRPSAAPERIAARVTGFVRSLDPLEFTLKLELPSAYRRGLVSNVTTSETPLREGELHRGGSGWPSKGEVVIWISPLDGEEEDSPGIAVVRTVRARVPKAGHWVVRVYAEDNIAKGADQDSRKIWQERVELGPTAPRDRLLR